MGEWSRWYRVVKKCGRQDGRYIYDQSTRRVDGRTETRNRYVGIVGGAAIRDSLSLRHENYVRPGDVVAKAEHQETRAWQSKIRNCVAAVMAALEGNRFAKEELSSGGWLTDRPEATAERLSAIDKHIEGDRFARELLSEVVEELRGQGRRDLAERNRRVLVRWPASYLNFNLQAFERSATAIGVDLERELVRIDRKPTIEAKVEALHQLWGLLHVEDRFAGVRSRLANIRDAAVGEDDEAVARLDGLLSEDRKLDQKTLKEELVEISMRAQVAFVRREVGGILERLLKQPKDEKDTIEKAIATGARLERRLFAESVRKFGERQEDTEKWEKDCVPIGDARGLRRGDVVGISGVFLVIVNVLDLGNGPIYQVSAGAKSTWQYVSAETLEIAGRLGVQGLECG